MGELAGDRETFEVWLANVFDKVKHHLDERARRPLPGAMARRWPGKSATVRAMLDTSAYEKGIKISDKEMREREARRLHRRDFHGDRNYTVTAEPAAGPASSRRPRGTPKVNSAGARSSSRRPSKR
jgi:hypothetical protein